MVLSNAIGRQELGTSYELFPGFRRTIVRDVFKKAGKCWSCRHALARSVSARATGSLSAFRKWKGISSFFRTEREEQDLRMLVISFGRWTA
jgi:hypothetical protein